MHELSIAMALVDDVARALETENAISSVTTVRVRIGKLSGVDAEALKQAFPIAAENTCCNAAQLAITEIETQATCNACGAEFMPEFAFCICTACNSTDVAITGGRELLLESIELNDTEQSDTIPAKGGQGSPDQGCPDSQPKEG
ncbi:MAG: hydrogenase maturation nickel metallochaperone HypA [Kiritimatiellae bacterium]|nr:hydrogenase maturation nickel metallochaperone HypA [Kiritimatiellia bacterium]